MRINVFSHSTSIHTAQAYTGIAYLERLGEIDVNWLHQPQGCEWNVPGSKGTRYIQGFFIQTNDGELIYLDFDDGKRINEKALAVCKTYFKRSYRSSGLTSEMEWKIFPWGLNYEVHPDNFHIPSFMRTLRRGLHNRKDSLTDAARFIEKLTGVRLVFGSFLSEMSAPPNRFQSPKVLFNVRTWDPDERGADGKPLSQERRNDRILLNETRAACLRKLKSALKDRFIGGFSHTEYAKANYADLLLPSQDSSSKEEYINTLNNANICIATTGLHESIGWKLAEYVAFSKAVVTEALKFQPSGPFSDGVNYLSFSNPDECFSRTMHLFESKQARDAMMNANSLYYQCWLHPAQMIRRALCITQKLPLGFSHADRKLVEDLI